MCDSPKTILALLPQRPKSVPETARQLVSPLYGDHRVPGQVTSSCSELRSNHGIPGVEVGGGGVEIFRRSLSGGSGPCQTALRAK